MDTVTKDNDVNNLRTNVINLILKKLQKNNVTDKQFNKLSNEFEKSIYNWTIQESINKDIIKNWNNPIFKSLYLEKVRSILTNIDKTSYLQNEQLIEKVLKSDIKVDDIVNMKPEALFPEKWINTVSTYNKKYENFENQQSVAVVTDMFKCGKCKGRRCTFYEIFSRSADEPAVLHIKCLDCGNSWRIG